MQGRGFAKKNRWMRLAVAATWLLVWQAASVLLSMPVLLPSPVSTARTLLQLAVQGAFWQSILGSLGRIGLGYVLAVVLGCLLAILCSVSAFAETMLSPIRTLVRSTPITSFIILVLLWLSIEKVPVFIAMLTVLPIIWQNVQQGIQQVDIRLLEMTRAYRFSWINRLRYLYVPSVLPYFYTACATSMGFAWKAGIAAEVIAKPGLSIGKNLQDAKVYLNTEELFAWTLSVILLSLLLEHVLKRLLLRSRMERGQKHVTGA